MNVLMTMRPESNSIYRPRLLLVGMRVRGAMGKMIETMACMCDVVWTDSFEGHAKKENSPPANCLFRSWEAIDSSELTVLYVEVCLDTSATRSENLLIDLFVVYIFRRATSTAATASAAAMAQPQPHMQGPTKRAKPSL